MGTVKVFAVCGSGREASFNARLLNLAMDMARSKGADIVHWDVRAQRVPLFEQRVEEETGRFPDAVVELRETLATADAAILACPEYNANVTPLLKSVIDWGSRKDPVSGTGNLWENKVVGLMSASPGALGGARGLMSLRPTFAFLDTIVVPAHTIVPNAYEAFNEDGSLKNQRSAASLNAMLDQLIRVTRALKAA